MAEDLLTCLAEKMYYFYKEILTGLDIHHITGLFPPFEQRFVLWEVTLQADISAVLDLNSRNASACNVYPSLMLNPSQDYEHLKSRRATIQSSGYRGLRAPSSRIRGAGNMVVLFEDQSHNVQSITPYDAFFRLITANVPHAPFTNHATEVLDFEAGEVRITPRAGLPHHPISSFQTWQRVEFNH